jgi:hypothetical protein
MGKKVKIKGKTNLFTLNKTKLFGHRKGKIPSRTKMWNKLEEIIQKDYKVQYNFEDLKKKIVKELPKLSTSTTIEYNRWINWIFHKQL